MMQLSIISYIGIGFLCISLYLLCSYKRLVQINTYVRVKWSDIEILLKQRYAELFKLFNLCKKYMQYEKQALHEVSAAWDNALKEFNNHRLYALNKAEKILQDRLARIYILTNKYPQLAENKDFQKLQDKLITLDREIAASSLFYNNNVQRNNFFINKVSHKIIAHLFSMDKFEMLEL